MNRHTASANCNAQSTNFPSESKMQTHKPPPLFEQPARNVCPICGVVSYSRNGVHPQCAVKHADEPRSMRLRLQKKLQSKPKSSKRRAW
jgi:hypothetical protein